MNAAEQWESIALEYKKEIDALHKDIEAAVEEFEKRMPRSYEKGMGTLDRALENSHQNLYLIKLTEYAIMPDIADNKPNKPDKPIKPKDDSLKNCFGDLL